MKGFDPTALLGLLLVAGIAAAADETVSVIPREGTPREDIAARDGVALLHNGNLVSGRITRAEDGYEVAVPGGWIFLDADNVAMIAASPLDCYRRQLVGLDGGDADVRFQLAQWCLRNQLLPQAASELHAARALEPDNPRVMLLQRRVEVAEAALARLAVSDRKPSAKKTVRLSSGGEPAETARPHSVALRGQPEYVPPAALAEFTRTIQPLLLNRCATAQCHGTRTSTSFRLRHGSAGGRPLRRTTLDNLRAVVRLIDKDNARASLLLTVPTGPHGTRQRSTAIFPNRASPQYERLAKWVRGFSKEPVLSVAAVPPIGRSPSEFAVANPAPNSAASATTDARQDTTPPPSTEAGFVPRDAFDPEIFNRQFFGK